ncbi:nucleoside deaminase [Patescibacteria group bacterium]|nr:nucleoside deaminase [Patescibacteria group bacterium]MBU1705425.1 nucleoside deaminase [Patescibacteria group bacterium]
MKNHQQQFMQAAIDLSRQKMQQGAGGPFGAVVVKGDQIVGRGWNQVTSTNDPTAHAEVVAIRDACQTLTNFNLEGCELYTSCLPCPMCLAAIYWSRIRKVYFGNTVEDAAKIGFDDQAIYQEVKLTPGQGLIKTEQLMHEEALKAFDEWEKKEDKIPY